MGRFRQLWMRWVSEVSWRLPGWPGYMLHAFSQAEQGSFYDMLSAAELTERRSMRRKYLEHALDEGRHTTLFLDQVKALSTPSRSQAAVWNADTLITRGIVGSQTLFERLGELEFMAFVYTAERDAVEQFEVYLKHRIPAPPICDLLQNILRDEHFHVSYSRAALEHYRRSGQDREVTAALRRVWWRRLKEGWLRFSQGLGSRVASIWLFLLYILAIPPFALIGRLDDGGWRSPTPERRGRLAAARSQG